MRMEFMRHLFVLLLTVAPALALAEEDVRPLGSLKGRVTDARTGEPLVDAQIKVVRGGEAVATTDLDGQYGLELPEGKYELRVRGDLYRGRRLRGVVVKGTT